MRSIVSRDGPKKTRQIRKHSPKMRSLMALREWNCHRNKLMKSIRVIKIGTGSRNRIIMISSKPLAGMSNIVKLEIREAGLIRKARK